MTIEIEKKLNDKKQELEARLLRLSEHQEPLDQDSGEAALQLEGDEVRQKLEEEARFELKQIEKAFKSIAAGTYGKCASCQDQIPSSRLAAMPFATRCLACASDT